MRLHERVKEQARIIDTYAEHIATLTAYLNSSKFDFDTTVQVGDISLRLTELRLAVWKEESC